MKRAEGYNTNFKGLGGGGRLLYKRPLFERGRLLGHLRQALLVLGNHAGRKWANFYNFIPCVVKNLPVPEFGFSLFERFTIWRLPLTRAVKVLSSVQTCGLVDVNQMFPWFSRVFQEKILSPFLEHLEEIVGV